MKGFLLAALTLFTLDQLRSAQCQVYCIHEGYDSGFYRAPSCGCVDLIPFERVIEKKLRLPKKRNTSAQLSPQEFLVKPSDTDRQDDEHERIYGAYFF